MKCNGALHKLYTSFILTNAPVLVKAVRRQSVGGHNAGGQSAGENCMVGQNPGKSNTFHKPVNMHVNANTGN